MIQARLSLMMFLQFFVWGSWYVTVAIYFTALGFKGTDIGTTYSVGPIAAIVSPFFLGMIADRFFSAQKVLGFLHLLGGVIMFLAASMSMHENVSPMMINGMLLLFMLCYMPTLGLVNTVSFSQLKNTEKQFPYIRVFGTCGWIVAGIVVSKILKADATVLPLQIAAGASILLGVYCFTLPDTPPKAKGEKIKARDVLCLDALQLMKKRSFAIFMICSLLICIPLSFYYAFTATFISDIKMANPGFKMTFGQMSEVLFMLVMPFFFTRLGVKKMLAFAMLAWVARYLLFAFGVGSVMSWMIILGILLHGICYDFFFVVGQIYTDQEAPERIRGSAQGFLVQCTLGWGMLIGAQFAGYVKDYFTIEQMSSWKEVWLVPAIFSLIVFVVFVLMFKERAKSSEGAVRT